LLRKGSVVCRGYQLKFGYDAFNPGFGDTRFAPFQTSAGTAVPTMYAATDDIGVLLETVLHDVHHDVGDRVVYESIVRKWGLAYIRLPVDLRLIDLRDEALEALGFDRGQIVATTTEHYECTREWSTWLHAHKRSHGIVWHSRQAELHAQGAQREVVLLFGDRVPTTAGAYALAGPGVRNLIEGPGRIVLERLAEELDARIELADD
jgi:RES domain